MNRSLKKIWNVISSILVAVVVLLALLLVGARIVGLQVFTVLSGSMEPTYHTGSLIYVKKVDPYTIEVGQPITFMLDESTIATHRVVGIVPDEEDPSVIRFRTKGDANEAEDGSLVHYKNVIGTPIFSIPYLGYVADISSIRPEHTSRSPQAQSCCFWCSCRTCLRTTRIRTKRRRKRPGAAARTQKRAALKRAAPLRPPRRKPEKV